MSDMQSLENGKQALDKGLITQEDFDSIKEGFVAAQKLKAGVDAGLLKVEDYERARDAFFELMGVTGHRSEPSRVVKRPANVVSHTVQSHQPPAKAPVKTQTATPAKAPVKQPVAQSKPSPPKPKASTEATTKTATASKGQKATSMSGISVNDEAIAQFDNMRGRSEYVWMTFTINATGTEVVLAETAGEGANLDDFIAMLPDNECRYGVYDFPYDASENRSFNKIVFFNWAPDSASIKQKMMFASTKAFFKQALPGIQVEMHCTDHDDVTEDNVRDAIKATLTRA